MKGGEIFLFSGAVALFVAMVLRKGKEQQCAVKNNF
jgi:hypothetical protein